MCTYLPDSIFSLAMMYQISVMGSHKHPTQLSPFPSLKNYFSHLLHCQGRTALEIEHGHSSSPAKVGGCCKTKTQVGKFLTGPLFPVIGQSGIGSAIMLNLFTVYTGVKLLKAIVQKSLQSDQIWMGGHCFLF